MADTTANELSLIQEKALNFIYFIANDIATPIINEKFKDDMKEEGLQRLNNICKNVRVMITTSPDYIYIMIRDDLLRHYKKTEEYDERLEKYVYSYSFDINAIIKNLREDLSEHLITAQKFGMINEDDMETALDFVSKNIDPKVFCDLVPEPNIKKLERYLSFFCEIYEDKFKFSNTNK